MKPHDLQWFKDRIGQRVYRENNKCKCNVCVEVFERGLIIKDEIHAYYLLDCQNELELIYTDNINKQMSNQKQTAVDEVFNMIQSIPSDAHSFEVFAIKYCEESPTGKKAFIGFKIANGDFHFIGVPYTEPKQQEQ